MKTDGAPGLFAGIRCVLGGMGFVARTPAAWPWAVVPVLVFLVLVALCGWASVSWVQPWIGGKVGGASGEVVGWLGAALALLAGTLVAMALTPPLSGPALDHLASLQERALGVPTHEPIGLLAEIWAGLRAEVLAAIVGGPILVVLTLVGFFVPVAAPATVPLKFVVASAMLAWGLFDYPLTLRGVPMGERFRFLNRHGSAAIGFGLVVSLLFWLPCFGILMLPVGVAGATRLLWEILEHDPGALPSMRSAPPDR